jgi:type IV secretory pathway VirB2 component (pilin)
LTTAAAGLLLAAPAFAQGNSPWENAVNVLQQAFTSTIARGLSLVAIVVSGLTFAFGEGGSKRVLAGVLFGVGMAIGLLPNVAALRSAYGGLLGSKLAGFLLLLTLAAFNRWRAVPALLHEPSVAVRWYRRALLTEYGLLASVLSVTAVMTSLFSWH